MHNIAYIEKMLFRIHNMLVNIGVQYSCSQDAHVDAKDVNRHLPGSSSNNAPFQLSKSKLFRGIRVDREEKQKQLTCSVKSEETGVLEK
jgi:hypothetical protein